MPVNASDIERELRRIGRRLTSPRTGVLFGGCAMSVQGFKDSTRDTDLVVLPPTDLQGFLQDLDEAGYKPIPRELDEIVDDHAHLPEGWPLEEWLVVERSTGLRIDLFPPTNVFRGFHFGDAMLARTTGWFVEGNLTVRLADATMMLMLKSITGRWHHTPDLPRAERRDLEDLPMLLSRGGIDWRFIEQEWQEQEAHLQPSHKQHAKEAMEHLRGMGFHVPWTPNASA